ncbi:MBL fold metallo-hydrolase [Pararhizobium sp. IMCC21322]|uniref:MBL fold metallo-hydrolase n=1 Tax=Pararhizobium sp. IMCC21322 TaxID=3067903 RepID=UPI002740DE7C|nr:MBL fold metallo-hydrolase [Pararhizobium sp. IMCC21322]
MPSIKKFAAGNGTITSIYDGELLLGPEMFSGISDAEVTKCLANIGLTEGPVSGSLNAYIYQDGDKTILIDSGGKAAIPGTGQLLDGMKLAGIAPHDIDMVLCTHLHPDHIGGLIDEGEAVFTNAELKIHDTDREFWLNAENREKTPEDFKVFFDLAGAVLNAYQDRTSTFIGETEVVSGVNSVPLPGHTPGHSGFQIGDVENGLLIWGDIVHVQAFQMPQPKACIAFDVDSQTAAATRIAMFERASKERLRIAGMHLAHPGVGYVVPRGDGFWLEPAHI